MNNLGKQMHTGRLKKVKIQLIQLRLAFRNQNRKASVPYKWENTIHGSGLDSSGRYARWAYLDTPNMFCILKIPEF